MIHARPMYAPLGWRRGLTQEQLSAMDGVRGISCPAAAQRLKDLQERREEFKPRQDMIGQYPVLVEQSTFEFKYSGILRYAGPLAIIRIGGMISTDPWCWCWDWTPVSLLCQACNIVAANSACKAVLLDIDCGGGDAHGSSDTEAHLRAMAKAKPVYAIAHDRCYSAAYYAACCGAREIVGSPSCGVGAVGTSVGPIVDSSKHNESEGYMVYACATPKGKAAVAGHTDKVPQELLDNVQAAVEAWNKPFASAVMKARGLSEADIEAMQAGIFAGADAVSRKLIDRVKTFGEYCAELLSKHGATSIAAPISPAPTATPNPTPGSSTRKKPMALTADQLKDLTADELAQHRPDLVPAAGPKAATLAELKQAFAGDELALFREGCLEAGMTMQAAHAAHGLVKKQVDAAKAAQPAAGTTTPAAPKAPGAPGATAAGAAAVAALQPGSTTETKAGAPKTYEEAVELTKAECGGNSYKAREIVNIKHPALRADFVQRCRASGKPVML